MSALFDFVRYVDCDGRLPQIGDGGGSLEKSLRAILPYDPYDERALIRIPSQRDFYAARLQAASSGDLERFRNGQADWWLLFHGGDVSAGALHAVPPPFDPQPSHLFPDSGIAILRAGSSPETRQHVAITFSKGHYGHGHPDKLAINILRYGYDISADLGYPTTWTDIKASGWEQNTASHCTVMLDERGQSGNFIGALNFYKTMPQVDVVEASAEKAAYPQASLYRRTVALVRDEKGEPLYTFDVFRIAGAATRDYLFHSLGKPEDLAVTLQDNAARWVVQTKGTLAGENVEPMTAGGYGFLFDVHRVRSDAGGVATWLQARDSESVGLALHFLGAPGREVIRAKAEGYGVRGKSPLEGHLILRDRMVDPAAGSAFVSVIEAFRNKPRVTAIDPMVIAPAGDATPDGRARLSAVAVRVKAGDRVDYLLGALDAKPRVAELDGVRVEFSGRFGLVSTRGGKVTGLSCVGGSIACGDQRVQAQPTVKGKILNTEIPQSVLIVHTTDARMQPLPGEYLLVQNRHFIAPAVYGIVKADKVKANIWRIQVNLPLTIARGIVGRVDTAHGAFASRTPVMKLRVNPGLFDGKRVRPRLTGNVPEFLLKSATESAFELADPEGIKAFPKGGEYIVLDVGAGDEVEIVRSAAKWGSVLVGSDIFRRRSMRRSQR